MKVLTGSLEEATYYFYWGGRVLTVAGHEQNWKFELEIDDKIFDIIKGSQMVNYKRYMRKREKLKELANNSKTFRAVNVRKGQKPRSFTMGDIPVFIKHEAT